MNEQHRPLIMLVDDDLHLLRALGDCLQYEGFDVAKATCAEEALDLLVSLRPELIVLDVVMPGQGGSGFLSALSDRKQGGPWRVLIYTAHPDTVPLMPSVSVIGALQKPCPHHVLARHVRSALAMQSYERRERTPGAQVLLAENDEAFAAELSALFGAAGHQTTVVGDGMAVLQFASSSAPDAIVMKQSLPMMKGTSVAPLISVMPRTRHVPVLIYSEIPFLDGRQEDDAVLPKGITKVVVTTEPSEILAALSEALSEALATTC